jgi:mono/diheme cytochrome c family protein
MSASLHQRFKTSLRFFTATTTADTAVHQNSNDGKSLGRSLLMKSALATRPSALLCIALPALLLATGCGKTDPPRFHLNRVDLVRQEVPEKQQEVIADVLEAMFGTPDEPHVLPEFGLDKSKIALAAGPIRSDEGKTGKGLYRQHCGHCHGTTGDGMGPTAAILDPYPRDYRPGKFKFKSTERAAKPTDADLERILRLGVPGTAMPSFDLLASDEIAALVEYVKYLSIRGEFEQRLVGTIQELGEGEELALTRQVLIDEVLAPVTQSWQEAANQVIRPEPRPEGELAASISKGRELFYGAVANCVKCHGPSSLGDGQTTDFDDWSKPLDEWRKELAEAREALKNRPEEIKKQRADIQADKEKSDEDKKTDLAALDEEEKNLGAEEQKLDEKERVLTHAALKPRNIIPRNLRLGNYRGGGRPLDLYRRIHAGINGAPMPGVGPAGPGAQGQLKPDEIWALVDYVRSLPYEPVSRPPRQSITAATQNPL